jgi:hypothetical protein
VLGTWSYFGLQTDQHLRYVSAVCTALTFLFLLLALVAPSLNRLWPTTASARWLAGRRYLLLAGVLALVSYLAFMTVRAGKPMLVGAAPLSLNAPIAVAIAAAALALFALTRDPGAKPRAVPPPSDGLAQRLMALTLALLLTGALFATRHETLSAALVAACFAAWAVGLCATFRPTRTLGPA